MSRPFAAVSAGGESLSLVNAVGMNFAASDTPGMVQHRMDNSYLCSVMVQLMAQAQEGGQVVKHVSLAGAQPAVVAHAVMMVLAWLVLLPVGERHGSEWDGRPWPACCFLWNRAVAFAHASAALLPVVASAGCIVYTCARFELARVLLKAMLEMH